MEFSCNFLFVLICADTVKGTNHPETEQLHSGPDWEMAAIFNDIFKDENKYWHSIRSRLSITSSNQFQFEVMDGDGHTTESVDIPGTDKAVFVTRGMNTSLIAIRTLDKPVVVKTEPSKRALRDITEYKYELIEMDGFTLEECMSFFRTEESN